MIEIWLDTSPPPSGKVVAPGEEPKEFDGWLQLLHILGDLLAEEPSPRPTPAVPP